MYSLEQEIKVQEGGDRGRAVSWPCVTWKFPDKGEDSHEIQSKQTLFTLPSAGSAGMNAQFFNLARVKVQSSPDTSDADNIAAEILLSYNTPGFQTPNQDGDRERRIICIKGQNSKWRCSQLLLPCLCKCMYYICVYLLGVT